MENSIYPELGSEWYCTGKKKVKSENTILMGWTGKTFGNNLCFLGIMMQYAICDECFDGSCSQKMARSTSGVAWWGGRTPHGVVKAVWQGWSLVGEKCSVYCNYSVSETDEDPREIDCGIKWWLIVTLYFLVS